MPAVARGSISSAARRKENDSARRNSVAKVEIEVKTKKTRHNFDSKVDNKVIKFFTNYVVSPLPYQSWVRDAYQSDKVQVFVAILIFTNFIVAAINAQMVPEPGSPVAGTFVVFEYFFGIIFLVELIFNMYGHWIREFFSSGWNWFDLIIVIISLLALFLSGLPGIAVLRLFRAFRVFRLFKRIPSLRVIVFGVFSSLGGVFNAFMVLFLLMGIWSIMGVEFYGIRQPQWFGNFGSAIFTLWQVMSMDSWSSQIARGIIFGEEMPLASIYFVSYLFVTGIIMSNVVVAILLDKYLGAVKEIAEENATKLKAENGDVSEDGPVLETALPLKLRQLNDEDLHKLMLEMMSPRTLRKIHPDALLPIFEKDFLQEHIFAIIKLKRNNSFYGKGSQARLAIGLPKINLSVAESMKVK